MTAVAAAREAQRNGTASVEGHSILPDETLSFANLCAHIHGRLFEFLGQSVEDKRLKSVQEQSRISLEAISQALHKYSPHELSFSYNGGKDCLVLLVLYLAGLHQHRISTSNPEPQTNVQTVYIQSPNPFKEVEDFVASSSKTYSLTMTTYSGSMKAAFSDYLRDHPTVKAIFVGTRRTDPHGAKLTHFDRTDSGWPDFIRIHPVIDWHYADIWTFIRHLRIPYCSLYDQGYTSLGGTTDTYPNPALRLETVTGGSEDTGVAMFRPAYELIQDEQERLGRDKATKIHPPS